MHYKAQFKNLPQRRHEAHNHKPPVSGQNPRAPQTRRPDTGCCLQQQQQQQALHKVHNYARQKASSRCQMRSDLISKPMATLALARAAGHGSRRLSRPQQIHPRAHTYLSVSVSGLFCVILPIVLSRMAMICCESIHHPSHLTHLNHRQQPAPQQQWSTPQAQLIRATTTISSSTSGVASNHQSDAPLLQPIMAAAGISSSNKTTQATTGLVDTDTDRDRDTELELKYPRNIKEIITSISYDTGSFQPATTRPTPTTGNPLFNHQVQSSGPEKLMVNGSEPASGGAASQLLGGANSTAASSDPLLNRTNSWQHQQQPAVVSFSQKTSSHHQLAPLAGRLESRIVTNQLHMDEAVAGSSKISPFTWSSKGSGDSLRLPVVASSASGNQASRDAEMEQLRKDNRVGDYVNSGDYESGFDANEAAELAPNSGSSSSDTSDTQRSSTSSPAGTSSPLPVAVSSSSGTASSGGSLSGSDESDSDLDNPLREGGSGTAESDAAAEQDDDISDSTKRLTTGGGSGGSSSSSSSSSLSAAREPEDTATVKTMSGKTKKLRTARQQYRTIGGKQIPLTAPSVASNTTATTTTTSTTSGYPSVTASEWFSRGDDTKATTSSSRPLMGDRHLIRARHLASRFSTLIRDGNANQSSGPNPAMSNRISVNKARPAFNNDAEDHPFEDNNVGYLLEDNRGSKTRTSTTKKVTGTDAVGAKNRAYSSPSPSALPASSQPVSRAHLELAMKLRQTNLRALERASDSRQLSSSLESLLKHPAVSSSLPLLLGKLDAVASLNQGYLNRLRPPQAQSSSSSLNLSAPQAANQVREYKTNYSSLLDNYLSSSPTPPFNGSPIAATRPQIKQRDLRGNSGFVAGANDKQHPNIPIKDSFVPYYGSSSNHTGLLNFHGSPFVGVPAQKPTPLDSIVRPGPLMGPTGNPLQYLGSMMSAAAPALLPQQVQDDHMDFGFNHMKSSMGQRNLYNGLPADFQVSSPTMQQHFQHQNRSHLHPQVDHMLANSNQLGVAHLGPASLSSSHLSDSSSYSSFLDYPDRSYDSLAPPPAPLGSTGHQKVGGGGGLLMGGGSIQDSGSYVNHSPQASTTSTMMSDDYRSHLSDYQSDLSSYEPAASSVGSSVDQRETSNGATKPSRAPNSRSSQSDVYYRQEAKSRDSSGGGGGGYPSRSSMASDTYEDVSNNISPIELEKDLTDLDEEFTRANFRRPSSSSSGDSYMPERYESRRYNSRRPAVPANYETYSNDYNSGASSSLVSSPRSYYRAQYTGPWATSSYYDTTGDWWGADALAGGADYSPLASYLTPNHYAGHYRWRPVGGARYQRTYAPATHPYLAAAASEQQHMHPAYNLMPAATGAYSTAAGPLQPATETISFSLSPLAAAAAAAASALAVADKTRHHHHNTWLTGLPHARITSGGALGPSLASAASSGIAGYPAPAAAFYPRPNVGAANPYAAAAALAAASMPFYALAPRSAVNPLAAAASTGGTAAYSLPYPYGAGPLVAYRPTSAASLLAAAAAAQAPLLGAASFAYPTAMRFPVRGFAAHPAAALAAFNPKLVRSPYHGADLQFAETKPKPNVTNNNHNNSNNNHNSDNTSSSGGKSPLRAAGAITAMAKNLTRKMFGSSSQPRPSHTAPHSQSSQLQLQQQQQQQQHNSASAALYDFFGASHVATGAMSRRRR